MKKGNSYCYYCCLLLLFVVVVVIIVVICCCCCYYCCYLLLLLDGEVDKNIIDDSRWLSNGILNLNMKLNYRTNNFKSSNASSYGEWTWFYGNSIKVRKIKSSKVRKFNRSKVRTNILKTDVSLLLKRIFLEKFLLAKI